MFVYCSVGTTKDVRSAVCLLVASLSSRCFRKLFGISYIDHITNEEVNARVGKAIGPYEDLLTSAKRRKLKWYGHITRSSGLTKTILQGDEEAGRGNDGKTTSKSGLALNGISYCGKPRTARSGGSWL